MYLVCSSRPLVSRAVIRVGSCRCVEDVGRLTRVRVVAAADPKFDVGFGRADGFGRGCSAAVVGRVAGVRRRVRCFEARILVRSARAVGVVVVAAVGDAVS